VSYFDAVILGVLQGLTEFLPVSSSGHLVLAQAILKVKQSGVSFEVLLHLGSLLAVLVYFRATILRMIQSLWRADLVAERKLVVYIIIGTIPAVLAGLLLRDFFERAFSNPVMTSVMLLVTGLILVATRFVKPGGKQVSLVSAIIMGVGQAFAILPGISRSGTTISAGMFAKAQPSRAAEFSFLLAIPAILGAVVLKLDDLAAIESSLLAQYFIGVLVTFVASLFAVYAVLKVVKKGKFVYFGYYCFAAGAAGLYLFL